MRIIPTAIIEMPSGTKFKMEVNKYSGRNRIDRVLSVAVPFNYGYINGTLAEDGDPLDVFVIETTPIPPLTEALIEPLGILRCLDNGVVDDKVIATLYGVPPHQADMKLKEIVNYLNTYKQGFQVIDFVKDGLQEYIERSMA